MTDIATPEPLQAVHAIFAGPINEQAVQRIANAFAVGASNGIKQINLVLQTGGGTISDGVCLYNLFRTAPIEIVAYNIGSVCSAGVIAYLGATKRIVSKTGTFMIHRTSYSPVGAGVERLQATANAAILDDHRIERILHENIKISEEKWATHRAADLWLSAEEAVESGLATQIGDFAPPKGGQIFYVGQL